MLQPNATGAAPFLADALYALDGSGERSDDGRAAAPVGPRVTLARHGISRVGATGVVEAAGRIFELEHPRE